MKEIDIIGTGWQFPPTFHKELVQESFAATSSGVENVKESVALVLHTKLNERVMRRSFGTLIHDLIFEPINENMKTYLGEELKVALELNEPRIQVDNLSFDEDQNQGKIDVNIDFTIRDTRTEASLVLPFYLPNSI